MFSFRRAVSTLLALAASMGSLQVCAASQPLPVPYSQLHAYTEVALTHWDGDPPGANDWSCKPSAAHPRPVVLMPSTFTSASVDWDSVSPYLANRGYCVFALNYGRGSLAPALIGLGDPYQSARELADFVTKVRHATGAAQVDIVGHSQGGMVSRLYIQYEGGTAFVHTMVLLSSPARLAGGLSAGAFVSELLAIVPSPIKEVIAGLSALTFPGLAAFASSDFWQKLNGVDQGFPGPVSYAGISSRTDELYLTTLVNFDLPATAHTSPTVYVQQYCGLLALPTHFQIPYSAPAIDLIGNALDPAHAIRPRCVVWP